MVKKDNIKKIIVCIILIVLILLSFKITYAVDENNNNSSAISISYESHVQDIGWQEAKKDGETSGTERQSKRIEALKIEGVNLPEGVELQYQAHVEYEGWQGWKSEGEIAGTEGKQRRIEALRIKLENTDKYSVQYRLHVQDIGWQDWCEDGEIAGTVGEGKRVEAIQIRIVEKQIKGIINLDTDLSNTTFYSDGIEFSGWKMANVPNTSIETYLNGQKIETEITYSADNNLATNTKGYGVETNNSNPRFNIKIDPSNLVTGT